MLGFVGPEDRFAQDVHIGSESTGPTTAQVFGDARLAVEHDCSLGLIAQAPKHQRHDDMGEERRALRSDSDEHPIEGSERARVRRRDESGETAGGAARVVEAGDLVGKCAREAGQVVVHDDPVQPVASSDIRSFLLGLDLQ